MIGIISIFSLVGICFCFLAGASDNSSCKTNKVAGLIGILSFIGFLFVVLTLNAMDPMVRTSPPPTQDKQPEQSREPTEKFVKV